ncbi:hypothetical protein [Hoylesella saccharolytica]|nr:hypothetical protein [Hoylesella saccharolytica]
MAPLRASELKKKFFDTAESQRTEKKFFDTAESQRTEKKVFLASPEARE